VTGPGRHRWLHRTGIGIAVWMVLFAVAGPARAVDPVESRRDEVPTAATRRVAVRPAPSLGHTVRSGETLWRIARRHGVPVDALRQANGLHERDLLAIGQVLAIPGRTVGNRQEPPSLAEIELSPPPLDRRIALVWPVAAPVGSPFGPRGGAWHGGVDLMAAPGTPIRAAAPGVVIASGWERGYGRVIKIWHTLDLMTVYAHNDEGYVQVGDWVQRGQVIGTVGSSGRASGSHLHFEIRLDGRKYDPLFWLPDPEMIDVAGLPPRGAAAAP
jgi:murein DD-endopeptidase MepM/ murein hydrolase activator NlpD